jgi:hypothetical protein
MKAKVLAAALALPSLGALWAQGALPFAGLGSEDSAKLGRGEAVIRTVEDAGKLSLAASGELADELRARIAELDPNYLSEVMAAIPNRKGAIEGLAATLADVQGYLHIEYFSKRQQKTYPLFDKMEVRSRRNEAEGETIEAWQHMDPFAEYGSTYRYKIKSSPSGAGQELFFVAMNTSPISYRGVQAVKSGDMAWILYAFPFGDRIVFYGVGAVRAFDMLGVLRDRLETSFLGRVEAFFGYMSQKLKGSV